MTDVVFGLLSAVANAIGGELSKGLTLRFPARQLIGPLFLLNALLVLPAAPFVDWTWSAEIVVLHLISVALLVMTSLAIWDLYDHGSAAATVTAQSISPLPAAMAVALLLPGTLQPAQAVAAVVVVLAVLLGLSDSFGALGRPEDAITTLETGAREAPTSTAIQLSLGEAYFRAGRLTDARARLEEARAKNPNGADAHRAAELLKRFPSR